MLESRPPAPASYFLIIVGDGSDVDMDSWNRYAPERICNDNVKHAYTMDKYP